MSAKVGALYIHHLSRYVRFAFVALNTYSREIPDELDTYSICLPNVYSTHFL